MIQMNYFPLSSLIPDLFMHRQRKYAHTHTLAHTAFGYLKPWPSSFFNRYNNFPPTIYFLFWCHRILPGRFLLQTVSFMAQRYLTITLIYPLASPWSVLQKRDKCEETFIFWSCWVTADLSGMFNRAFCNTYRYQYVQMFSLPVNQIKYVCTTQPLKYIVLNIST